MTSRILTTVLVAAVPLLACSKPDSGAPSSASTTTQASTPPTSPPPGAPAGKGAGVNGYELHCDVLVPEAIRTKYMPGWKLVEQGHAPHECNFTDSKGTIPAEVIMSWDCHEKRVDAIGMKAALDAIKATDKSGHDIPNLGRGAVEVKFMGAADQIHVFDDKTPCKITFGFGIAGPKTGQVDIARAVVAATTPAAVGM
jgi:hypothetical protein